MSVLAAEGAPAKRIRWKAGKENELWDFIQRRVAAGASVSEALKEFAQDNGISWLTARWKYYRLKQDRSIADGDAVQDTLTARAGPTVEETGVEVAPSPGREAEGEEPGYRAARGEAAYRSLTAFLRSVSGLDSVDLGGLLQGLATLSEMALAGRAATRELAALKSSCGELADRVHAYESRLETAAGRLSEVRAMVAEWLTAPGIDRVTSLDDFAGRLTAALDGMESLLSHSI